MTSTRLRWAACAALLACGLFLATSLINDGSSSSAPMPGTASGPAPSQPPTARPASDPSNSTDAPTEVDTTRPSVPKAVRSATPPDSRSGPPVRPDASLGLTVGAAEVLVHFYFDQAENYLKLTGDGSVVRALASPVCRPCQGEITIFRSLNGRNNRLTGDYLWKNIDVRGVRSTGANSTVVAVDLTRGRHTAILKPGAKPTHYPGGPAELDITLIAENGNWLVFDKAIR